MLFKNYYGQDYTAELVEVDGGIKVRYDNQVYNSPTAAAEALTSTRVNGWKFWRVRDTNGVDKGLLDDLRTKFTNNSNND